MSITSAIVLYAVIWFMVLFLILPLRLVTQGDSGNIVPGTPEGAPDHPQVARKLRLTTIVATLLWVVIAGVIVSGLIEIRDFDWMDRLPPVPEAGDTNG